MAYANGNHYCDRCNSRYEPTFTKYVPVYNYGLCLNCANAVLATIEQDEQMPQPQTTTHEKEYQAQAARIAELERERDAAIADAVKLARLVEEYPDVLLDEDRDLLEKYLNK